MLLSQTAYPLLWRRRWSEAVIDLLESCGRYRAECPFWRHWNTHRDTHRDSCVCLLLVEINSMVIEIIVGQALGSWLDQMRISIISSSCVELETFVVYLVDWWLILCQSFWVKLMQQTHYLFVANWRAGSHREWSCQSAETQRRLGLECTSHVK